MVGRGDIRRAKRFAVLNMRLGETAKARDAFTALVDDLEAPRNFASTCS